MSFCLFSSLELRLFIQEQAEVELDGVALVFFIEQLNGHTH